MRIMISRELGASAMGLVELAHSAQMLLITPVISGLPAAVSRMCAKASDEPGGPQRVLRGGVVLSLLTGLPLCLAGWVFSAQAVLWLGDLRTMPAYLAHLPCIPILGVSCVLNGYFYGIGKPMAPALGEIAEQLIRFFLSLRLVSLLRSWPMTLRAAIPAVAALIGETIGLLLMAACCARALLPVKQTGRQRGLIREMIALALPLTGMKLVSSLMRTVNATLIPLRLQRSGLPQDEALSLLGMVNGMLMPMLMLPSFVTGSLSAVCAPEVTRRQTRGLPQSRLCRRALLAALAAGLCGMGGIWLLAPVLANTLYRQAELEPLLRFCAPMIPMMAVSQVTGGLINGLGRQSESLRISLLASLVSVLLTYALAAQPSIRLTGVLLAMGTSQAITLLCSLRVLKQTIGTDAAHGPEFTASRYDEHL